ncbi:MAG: 50S ribosomal protein L1 [Actinomycetota bacterium]|nr:50S ribosomal protein L1 [Actinomycetota bacterium]MDK1017618.1 50S ribosomal protein L1 [Actinomycetota bacterium]MDK1026523.1 50S ribosomal protein L1 [Actinomycetota bacterium]MDK1037826.1 50S ribosomal protein L1 [Actinomycetota bacterium]MDK1097349.1 50S ribosomal protein L1 [Actinomycetota bacterium]
MGISKNRADQERKYDSEAAYPAPDAIGLVKTLAYAKFDESIDIAFQLGIDPRHADQIVRGTVSLPHGTGKDIKVVVFANDQAQEAEDAGADVVGGKELADEIASGARPLDWDVTIATPDMMPIVGKLGQVLGPRGLMPNPKSGTVTKDVGKTVEAFKAGRVEYRNDRYGNVHIPIGRVSFDAEKLVENLVAIADEIGRARPASSKGKFIRKVSISSTMGPGVKVDVSALEDLIKESR